MPQLKQTLLSFPAPAGGGPADSMERTADARPSDSPATPTKGSQVAVVIYTPNKTHVVQDIAPSQLPSAKQPHRGIAHVREGHAPDASIPHESDHDQDSHMQSPASPGPQLRRTRNRRNLTPFRKARPKRGGARQNPPQNHTQPTESGRHNASDKPDPVDMPSGQGNPAKPPPLVLVSSDSSYMDPTSSDDRESEEPESPSRNQRYINPRSFISGGVSGNAPISPEQPLAPKGPKLLRERAAQRRLNRPGNKSLVRDTIALHSLRSTRSGVKAEKLALTQEKHEVEESPVARKGSRRLKKLPALTGRAGGAEKASPGKLEKHLEEQEETDEDEDVISRHKRRRTQFVSGGSGQEGGEPEGEDQDDEENVEVPKASPSTRSRTRNRGGAVKPRMTRKQKLLEQLKSRRAGLSSAGDAVLSSSSESLKRGIYDTETETENESNFPDDEPDEVSGIEAVRKSLRGGRNNEYDTDFVVSDDEGDIGVPSHGPGLNIPIEFTLHAHKKLKEHFSDAIEWMVHNKLNPAFDRKDPVYRIAFQKLDLETTAYSSSKFESSVWTQGFRNALKARPQFYKETIISEDHDCEACNRKKHTATYKVQFKGKPYHHESLEEISSFSEGDDDDDGDDDSGIDYDSRGNALPDSKTIYYVGRVCCLNAETAHALTHWRYHLNEWVVDELHRQELFDPNAILTRESWTTKRRSAYANGIVKRLQESGEIARLYHDFKNSLDEACAAKPGRWGIK